VVKGYAIPFDKKLGNPMGVLFVQVGIEEVNVKPLAKWK